MRKTCNPYKSYDKYMAGYRVCLINLNDCPGHCADSC